MPIIGVDVQKYSLERYEEVIADFDEAIRLSIESPRVYYWRGLSKRRLGQDAASIVDFDIAIRLQPTDAYSHYHRGAAKFNLDRFDEAKVDLKEALSLAKQSDDDALIRQILNLLDKIE